MSILRSAPRRRLVASTAIAFFSVLNLVASQQVLAETSHTPENIEAPYQVKSSIKGKVSTSDGKPAEFSTIKLEGRTSLQVDKNGEFHFDNLEAGTYTLTLSFTGQETQTKTITLQAGETTQVDFTLAQSAQALNEVVIVGDKYNVSSRKRSNNIARLPLSNLENPQVYNVVDKELIREQMALTLDESFRNVPGAAPAKTGAGIPAFFSRGFQTSDNLRNGMATFIRTTIDLATVERVETIKGPASTLFGSTMISFGGLVNYVTKKPYETFGGELTYMQGSYDLSRMTADINTPVNDDKSLLFRMNMAYQKENSFQDQGHGTTFMIAPSVSYKVDDRLTLRFDADMQSYRGTASSAWIVGNGVTNTNKYEDLKLNYKRSLIDNSFVGRQYSNNIFVQAEYKLSKQWISTTNYAWATGEYNNLYMFNLTWVTDSTVARSVGAYAPDKMGRKHLQQNFTGDFLIGNMRNRLVVGLDYLGQYRNLKYFAINLDTVNTLRTAGDVRIQQVEDKMAATSAAESLSKQFTYSAYFSDVLNLTNNLLVMASLRVDHFVNPGTTNILTQAVTGKYNQTAFSPKFGIVYQPIKDQVAIFANYMNGFKNVGSVAQPDGTVSEFKPQQAYQWEAGIKLDLLKNKLNATISYYDIQVTKSTRPEVINNLTFTVQDGTQVSRGVEVEVIGNPLPGLNIVTGYGYNKNEYTKAAANIIGKRAVGTPKHVGSIWASYSLLKGALKGLGIGAGAMNVTAAWYNNTNTFLLPEYTVIDATIFYNRPRYRLSFKANNLTNEKYWVSDGFYARPQKLANFLTSISWKF